MEEKCWTAMECRNGMMARFDSRERPALSAFSAYFQSAIPRPYNPAFRDESILDGRSEHSHAIDGVFATPSYDVQRLFLMLLIRNDIRALGGNETYEERLHFVGEFL
jgi:hypothetical protein